MQAITVKELIKNLQAEDENATVIYQYYLAEHFDASEEAFTKAALEFDSIIPSHWSWDVISETVAEKQEEEEEND